MRAVWVARSVLHCAVFLSSPSLLPLSPPGLPPLPPCLPSSPREQAEPASSPHCAHSRCSPPLSLPMKEETTGVCMYPPIKTRLVGTLAGWGPAGTREVAGAPGEAVAGCRTTKEPCYWVLSSLDGWGNLGSSWGWRNQHPHDQLLPYPFLHSSQETRAVCFLRTLTRRYLPRKEYTPSGVLSVCPVTNKVLNSPSPLFTDVMT